MVQDIQNQIISIGRKMYHKEFIVATEGNISFRLDERRILATARGICKGEMQTDDLVLIDYEGNPYEQSATQPSTEIKLHLEVYRRRPDINAVIHAHPAYATSLTLAGISLEAAYLPESAFLLGSVPTAKYGRPSTTKIAESIRPYIEKTDVLMLERHGSLTIGKKLIEAYYKLEVLEHTAKIFWLARQFKHLMPIDKMELRELMNLRESVYGLDFPVIPFK